MYCDSALQKAYHQRCMICGKSITYGNYETITIKGSKGTKKSFKQKTKFLHTECYNKEYNQNKTLYNPKR